MILGQDALPPLVSNGSSGSDCLALSLGSSILP